MSFKKVAFYNRLCNGCLDFPSRHFDPDQLNIRLNPRNSAALRAVNATIQTIPLRHGLPRTEGFFIDRSQ